MKLSQKDKFVITGPGSPQFINRTKNWTVWLPEGKRWIQSPDGMMTCSAQGAGGFKTFQDAINYMLHRSGDQ